MVDRAREKEISVVSNAIAFGWISHMHPDRVFEGPNGVDMVDTTPQEIQASRLAAKRAIEHLDKYRQGHEMQGDHVVTPDLST